MSHYTYPGTQTPKNKFGIADFDELERVEAAYVEARRIEIDTESGPKGDFDVKHLKAIHKQLFQDVYEWAGRTRDQRVALSDGTTASEPIMRKAEGRPFAVGPAIARRLRAFSARLRKDKFLRGLSREAFAERAADAMAELNAIHPFREGNGRTQRLFMEQLAEAAGHNLDFTIVSKERMAQASIAANENNDPQMMRRLFDEISDPERCALLRKSIASLERLNFDWNERYIASLTPCHGGDLVLAGIAGDQFMARTESAVLFGRTADLPEPWPKPGATFNYGKAKQFRQSVGKEADAPRDFRRQAEAIETLYPPAHQQYDDDYQKEPGAAARVITPAGAVGPARQGAEKNQYQYDKQNRPEHFRSPIPARAIRMLGSLNACNREIVPRATRAAFGRQNSVQTRQRRQSATMSSMRTLSAAAKRLNKAGSPLRAPLSRPAT